MEIEGMNQNMKLQECYEGKDEYHTIVKSTLNCNGFYAGEHMNYVLHFIYNFNWSRKAEKENDPRNFNLPSEESRLDLFGKYQSYY